MGVKRICCVLLVEVFEVVHHLVAAVLAKLVFDVQAQDVLLLRIQLRARFRFM